MSTMSNDSNLEYLSIFEMLLLRHSCHSRQQAALSGDFADYVSLDRDEIPGSQVGEQSRRRILAAPDLGKVAMRGWIHGP
jgi:hypothetical protein